MTNPSDWIAAPLSRSIAALDAGVSVNAEDRPHRAGEVGILKTSALSGGFFRPSENKAVLLSERARVAEPVIADSILFSRMNTPALVGESCYIAEDWPTLFVPDRIWQLKPYDREAVSMRWLSYVLRSAAARAHIETHATGTSGSMKNLPKSKLLDLETLFPPVDEQRSIATILDTLDTTIRQTEAIIDKLKQVKQGLLHDLLTRGIADNGELRPPQSEAPHLYKESVLGWIPDDWCFGPIEQFLDRIIDYRGKTPEKTERGIPLITARNVRLGYVDPEPREFISEESFSRWMTRGIPKKGDVLFTTEAPLGNVGQIVTTDRLAFAQRMIILQAGVGLVDRFLKHTLLSQAFRRRLFAFGSGSTVEGIQQSTFRRIEICVPTSINEQALIVERLDAFELRVEAESQHLAKAHAVKAGLMDDLLTGRVRVTPLLLGAPA